MKEGQMILIAEILFLNKYSFQNGPQVPVSL